MDKKTKITIFIGTQLLLVVLHIHRHSLMVREIYRKQRALTAQQELTREIQTLTQLLYVYKDPAAIKQFATQKLGMGPIRITQIKKIEQHI